jgi:hypothetical protein
MMIEMTDYWKPEPELISSLDDSIPDILASQKDNGQFGTDPWISIDQNVLLALAAAWSLEESRYYGDEAVLSAIVQGGHALVDAQDDDGMFTFRKKDHSTWGQIYMPWVYSRWARAYWLTRDAFGSDDRSRWDAALTLGFTGISETCLDRVHNIPTHDSMGIYFAGLALEREDWLDQAVKFSHRVADAQSEHGWWPEHDGPVVAYNFVYVDALGTLYTMCKDDRLLEVLDRAARFHAAFAYPDGSMVETVDGRNWYHDTIRPGNPGFSHTPQGRGFLAQQHARIIASSVSDLPHSEKASVRPFDADYAATMLLHSVEGEFEPTAAASDEHTYRMGDLATVQRRRPWFFCANAFRQEPHENRWGQDWQNCLSVYHDQIGLVLGGGNTKLQPLWSNFTVGNVSRLKHTPGDEDPVFLADGLQHVPDKATIQQSEKNLTVRLSYGETEGVVSVIDLGDDQLGISYSCEDGGRVEGHLTLMPGFGETLKLSTGDAIPLGGQPFAWSVPGQAGFVEHNGWRLLLPSNTRIEWPVLPHNPYKKGGESEAEDGRIVVVMPFGAERKKYEMVLQIVK